MAGTTNFLYPSVHRWKFYPEFNSMEKAGGGEYLLYADYERDMYMGCRWMKTRGGKDWRTSCGGKDMVIQGNFCPRCRGQVEVQYE